MDARNMFPTTFCGLLHNYVGKMLGICCYEGRLCYIGTLIGVSADFVTIYEREQSHTISLSNIFSFNLWENNDENTSFMAVNSKLYQKFNYFLDKEVDVMREKKSIWCAKGTLKYIGNDYFAVFDNRDKRMEYIYAKNNFIMMINKKYSSHKKVN